mgnify:CR=1 FL=1
MKQLENLIYLSVRSLPQRSQEYFVVGDLEKLSASALYTGDLPPLSAGFGVGMGDSYGAGDCPADRVNLGGPGLPSLHFTNKKLSVLSLPNLGTSLHIHEGAGGSAHFKHDKGKGADKYSQINSYDAAMATLDPETRRIYEIICEGLSSLDKKKWGIE